MTNKEKTAWLGRYLHEQARQRMLYGEVEALQAQAARTAEFLGVVKEILFPYLNLMLRKLKIKGLVIL